MFFIYTGFDSDNSSGEFSEAVHKVDVDSHYINRTVRHSDGPVQENGIKKHRYVLLRRPRLNTDSCSAHYKNGVRLSLWFQLESIPLLGAVI